MLRLLRLALIFVQTAVEFVQTAVEFHTYDAIMRLCDYARGLHFKLSDSHKNMDCLQGCRIHSQRIKFHIGRGFYFKSFEILKHHDSPWKGI
jgi:hypothetical protein